MRDVYKRQLRKWIFSALLVAAGVLLSPLFSFPLGVTRAFPLQHMINTVSYTHLDVYKRQALQCVPAELVGKKRRHHVDTVLVAFAEHGFRRDAVVHIDHDGAAVSYTHLQKGTRITMFVPFN